MCGGFYHGETKDAFCPFCQKDSIEEGCEHIIGNSLEGYKFSQNEIKELKKLYKNGSLKKYGFEIEDEEKEEFLENFEQEILNAFFDSYIDIEDLVKDNILKWKSDDSVDRSGEIVMFYYKE